MPIHERAADRGARRARYLVSRTASELTIARRNAGLSQRELGRQLRVSHGTIGRAERGEPGHLTIEIVARMAAVLGLQFTASLHQDGDPVRDAAHLATLERFRCRLPTSLTLRTEIPVPIEGDRRSADAIIVGRDVHAMIEAETRIEDVLALERRISAKQRDFAIARVILLVADTRHNRTVVDSVPELRRRFPVTTRACLAALDKGRDPGGDAIVVL